MIKLPEEMEREHFEDLLKRDPKNLSENQRDFIRYMRLKEEFECGLDG